MKLIICSDETWQELQKWAAQEGKGGWQNLCAKLVASECTPARFVACAKQSGIAMCIETLQALEAAEEDEQL